MEETSGRVLVVDDDAGAGEMVAEFLGRRGYEVVFCETRAEALARVMPFLQPDSRLPLPSEAVLAVARR